MNDWKNIAGKLDGMGDFGKTLKNVYGKIIPSELWDFEDIKVETNDLSDLVDDD